MNNWLQQDIKQDGAGDDGDKDDNNGHENNDDIDDDHQKRIRMMEKLRKNYSVKILFHSSIQMNPSALAEAATRRACAIWLRRRLTPYQRNSKPYK